MTEKEQAALHIAAMKALDFDSTEVDTILADAGIDPETCTFAEAKRALIDAAADEGKRERFWLA